MAPLCYAAKFDPFLSLDCAPTPSTLAQSKERKESNFAIWHHWSKNRHHSLNACAFTFEHGGSTFVIEGELFFLSGADIRKVVIGESAIDSSFEIASLLPFASLRK